MRPVLNLLIVAAVTCVMGGCAASTPALPEGSWTGALTPMSHPEMANPVTYDVRYPNGTLVIDLIGPNGARIATRAVHHAADSLHFAFDEPEESVTLRCGLGRQPDSAFAGRCTDASGKWAYFTMVPPAS